MILLITIRFLDDRYHGRSDGGEPEWPPSPFRVFQAMLAGAKARWSDARADAFRWLEALPVPVIHAPHGRLPAGVLTYVPNNNTDDGEIRRTPKMIRPRVLDPSRHHVEYAWTLTDDSRHHAEVIADCARHIRCVGWGIDQAIGNGTVSDNATTPPNGFDAHVPLANGHWSGVPLRVPCVGSLESLEDAHAKFLDRIRASPESGNLEIHDYPGTGQFVTRVYAPSPGRPYCVFDLYRPPRQPHGSDEEDESVPTSVGARGIKALTGLIRGAFGTERVRKALTDQTVDGMLLGHPKEHAGPRLSILPLLSVGHRHADARVRRVILAEPFGADGATCHVLAELLNGHVLLPDHPRTFPLQLIRPARGDRFAQRWYVGPSKTWATVSPVLLPGFDQRRNQDHAKAMGRAEQLVIKSLAHAGIAVPCRVELSPVSWWPNVPHARDFVPRDKLGPSPRYHVKLTFDKAFTGPLSLGRQCHTGLGVFAALDIVRN